MNVSELEKELLRILVIFRKWSVKSAVKTWIAVKTFFSHLYIMILKVTSIYLRKRVPRSAAQMSFHIIFSIFPLLICINWFAGLLHVNYDETITFLAEFLPIQTVSLVVDYLDYIAKYQSNALLYAGIFMLIAPSSAALRALKNIINDVHNRGRHGRNFVNFLLSFVESVFFLLVVYVCIFILFTGQRLLNFLVDTFDLGNFILNWNWLRFIVLFIVLDFMLYLLYRFLPYNIKGKSHIFDTHVVSGVLFSSTALVIANIIFAYFINLSTNYSLIYGSLASIIIFMLWLYTCCNIVIIGSIINVIVGREIMQRRTSIERKKKKAGFMRQKML